MHPQRFGIFSTARIRSALIYLGCLRRMQRGGCRISCKTKAEPITLGPFKSARASVIRGLVLELNLRPEPLVIVAGESGRTSASFTTFLAAPGCNWISEGTNSLGFSSNKRYRRRINLISFWGAFRGSSFYFRSFWFNNERSHGYGIWFGPTLLGFLKKPLEV